MIDAAYVRRKSCIWELLRWALGATRTWQEEHGRIPAVGAWNQVGGVSLHCSQDTREEGSQEGLGQAPSRFLGLGGSHQGIHPGR